MSRRSGPAVPPRSSGCTSSPERAALGLARRLLARLEESAAAAGAEAMVLETGTAQPEAMALYESSGYARIENFGHYRWSPQNRCYGKPLAAG